MQRLGPTSIVYLRLLFACAAMHAQGLLAFGVDSEWQHNDDCFGLSWDMQREAAQQLNTTLIGSSELRCDNAELMVVLPLDFSGGIGLVSLAPEPPDRTVFQRDMLAVGAEVGLCSNHAFARLQVTERDLGIRKILLAKKPSRASISGFFLQVALGHDQNMQAYADIQITRCYSPMTGQTG